MEMPPPAHHPALLLYIHDMASPKKDAVSGSHVLIVGC
jgi:hypothetical protein